MKNILVICIGNICRSPMAEAILKHELPHHHVYSAGLGALIGHRADPTAVELMAEAGIDITDHVAQQISSALVSRADIVLVMDSEQKQHIERQYIGARGKVFRLGEAARVDIPDPYRQGVESFRTALRHIKDGVDIWTQQIKQMD